MVTISPAPVEVIDEDDMASNSATKVPTQQSVKAYVDATAGARLDKASRTSGNITCNGASWANLDTGLDLVITAAAGDELEVGASWTWGNGAADGMLDVATIVGGSPVNYFATGGSGTGQGLQAWFGPPSVFTSCGGGLTYTVQSGDISGGTVTLRLRVRTNPATNKVLFASSTLPLHWWVKNLGPI